MQQCEISLEISSTDYGVPLGLEIWLDDQCILDLDSVVQSQSWSHQISDSDDAEHELRFCLKNKLPAHTVIDAENRIVKDACLCLTNVCFDTINLDQILADHAVYQHDHNGSTDLVSHKFYGQMGCNGTVSLGFRTPVYVWLLEHM